ncbi:Eco57I restriction-modification methylase domain-containing protein [Halalkalibaculum sp. DA384]|uniref:Eco57I restriction-modification methylase domain-containing protein n=1 Tax=Halalkalibaculum sp. DA384 TaxID=3373606 RepID=UPI003754F51F
MDSFQSITIEGQILSAEILSKLSQEGYDYQTSKDFGLSKNQKLRDEIQFAYSLARKQWEIFKQKKSRWEESEWGTSDTRNNWMLPLLDSLGYELSFEKAEMVNGKSYNISHRDTDLGGFPIHIMSTKDKLEQKRDYGGSRLSPHGLVQEYLNLTEHLYGLVTNGSKLRLLRDSTRLSRLSYVEFDLEAMFEDELYSDFAVMFRLIHASRMPTQPEESPDSIIEQYHQDAIESGARIREKLRGSVEISLQTLGNGFLKHPDNEELRQLIANSEIDATEFYGKLLKIIYRLLFLMVSEERNMIYPKPKEADWDADLLQEYRSIYNNYYSINRLRSLAERKHQLNTDEEDLWESLTQTFALFEKEAIGQRLGIQALNGDLFSPVALDPLSECKLTNDVLLRSLDAIARFENENGQLTRVNYGGLDVEEFGSVYEALLDYDPKIKKGVNVSLGNEWAFQFAEGTERKTTGSYYTRTELVQELIKSALVPVIEERLEEADGKDERIQKLRDLKVCDPAVGSGHFLLAAARKIAEYLAKERTGEDQPGPDAHKEARREVIQHCIYGVDMNPMAVELCKVALWLESHSVGYPLTFLDHHIKCGNSLVGLDDLDRLDKGIPDGAFNDVIGDEKEITKKLKKRNRDERREGKQTELQDTAGSAIQALDQFAKRLEEIDQMPEQTVEDINQKAKAYNKFKTEQSYLDALHAANIWTGAFFIQKTHENIDDKLIPTTRRLHSYVANPRGTNARFLGKMDSLAQKDKYFHWPLEFPEVQAQNGFDVVLGNPPWERIKLQEKEFFAGKDEEIADAKNKAARTKLINKLKDEGDPLYNEYQDAKHFAEAFSNFVRESDRYPLTAKGDINTYQLFSGLDRGLIRPDGRAGFIVPSGIATDYYNQDFFGDVVEKKSILTYFDFENSEGLFDGVHRSYKFCLLTLGGSGYKNRDTEADFAFFLTHPNQLDDDLRRFKLTPEDMMRINPNTKTTPIFRTQPDAELTRKIYKNTPVLIKHQYNEDGKKISTKNPWGINFSTMFHMSGDSNLFYDEDAPNRKPLYEAKFIWHYDHRLSTFDWDEDGELDTREVTVEEKQDPSYSIRPRYWVNEREVWRRLTKVPQQISEAWKIQSEDLMKTYTAWWLYGYMDDVDSSTDLILKAGLNKEEYLPQTKKQKQECREMVRKLEPDNEDLGLIIDFELDEVLGEIIKKYSPNWLFGFRNTARTTDERTFISTITPIVGVGHSEPLIFLEKDELKYLILGNLNSLPFDFVVRQKSGGANLTFFIIEQLPVLKPDDYKQEDKEFIKQRVLELTYTSHNLQPFAKSLNYYGDPFEWDEERRAILKAELDAYYAKLYGLTEEELRYILDPEEEHGKDFPGETFRVLKNKEIRKYGEYRTRKLVLKAWERLQDGRPMMSESNLRLVGSSDQSEQKVSSIELVKPFQSSYDTQAVVVMNLIEAHSSSSEYQKHLGHVKCEKICHIIEYEAGLDQERSPQRDAAGPVDIQHLHNTEYKAEKKGWFTTLKDGQSGHYTYYKGRIFDIELYQLNQKLQEKHPQQFNKMKKIIELFLPFNREESEVRVTVYAAWNDLLLDGKDIDKETIVTEARENWHPDKLKIEREKFFEAIEWLVENELVPQGVGKHTVENG